MDERTEHEALPLKRGLKRGANLWIYARPWREVATEGCMNVPVDTHGPLKAFG